MKNHPKHISKKNPPIARHRILVFEKKLPEISLKQADINPLFLLAKKYAYHPTFSIHPN